MASKKSTPDLPPESFTSSAAKVRAESYLDVQDLKMGRQDWWPRAWTYYDDVPPLHFAGTFKSNAVSRLRLVPALRTKEGKVKEITDSPTLTKAIDALKSERGGHRHLLRQIELNLFVVGECYLVGYTKNEKGKSKQVWEVLSVDELEIEDIGPNSQIAVRKLPGQASRKIPRGALLIRIWQEHPRWSALADSNVRPILDACRSYTMFTRAEESIALSRVAGAGMLFMPQELIPTPSDLKEGETASTRFWDEMVEGMLTPMEDRDDPMNVVPSLITGPAEFGKAIQHIRLDRALDDKIVSMKDDAVRQIALGVNLPAEALLGQTGEAGGAENVSHFQSAMIRQDTFTDHVQPDAEMIVDAITVAYLHPALRRELGTKKIDDKYEIDDVFLWFDPSELVLEPDMSEKANMARDRLTISEESYRKAMGFSEEDAPSDEDYAKQVGVKLQDPNMAVTGETPPSEQDQMDQQEKLQKDQMAHSEKQADKAAKQAEQMPALPPGESPKAKPKGESGRKVETTSPDTGARSAPKGAAAQAPTQKTQRRVSPSETKPNSVTSAALVTDQNVNTSLGYMLGKVDVNAIENARFIADGSVSRVGEKVGAKLRSKARGDETLTASIDGMSNLDVAVQHGKSLTADLGLEEMRLIESSLAEVDPTFSRLVLGTWRDVEDLLEAYLGARAWSELAPLWDVYGPRIEQARGKATTVWGDELRRLSFEYIFGVDQTAAEQKLIRGAFDDLGIKPGDVRPVLSVAGGAELNPRPPDPGAVATGQIMREFLLDAGLSSDDNQFIWLYGNAPRSEGFQGHMALDGNVFTGWQATVLSTWTEDAWIGSDHYFPGDHKGCGCIVTPYTPNFGEPYEVPPEPPIPEDLL